MGGRHGEFVACGDCGCTLKMLPCSGVMVLVCDQPALSAEHLRRLLDAHKKDGTVSRLRDMPAVTECRRFFPAHYFRRCCNCRATRARVRCCSNPEWRSTRLNFPGASATSIPREHTGAPLQRDIPRNSICEDQINCGDIFFVLFLPFVRRGDRQREEKCAAAIQFAFGPNDSAMGKNNVFRDGKAKAGATGFPRAGFIDAVKALEDASQVFGSMPAPKS